MKVLFSKQCEYGILATIYIGMQDKNTQVSVDEISTKLKIPKEFVAKILQKLKHSGIVTSRKGKSGGFQLAKKTTEINLLELIEIIDGVDLFEGCLIGFPNCNNKNPCPVHKEWRELREQIKKLLKKSTVEKMKYVFEKKVLAELSKNE